ncbi:unnamed protein product, partial [marine sediment metagenome]
KSAGFLAMPCALNDKPCNYRKIAELDKIKSKPCPAVIFLDFVTYQSYPAHGAPQPEIAADNPDKVPHQTPDITPVM